MDQQRNGLWRIKTNLELMTKYKSQDIVNVIKIRRLEWIGHVIRMNETRSVKQIFEGKLEGRRGRGRHRLRWIDDVEDDLRKLGVKRWRAKALDREEWASVIREAKAKRKGQQSYRKKTKKKKKKVNVHSLRRVQSFYEVVMRNATKKYIHRYVNVLYYKQRSLLYVSATYCGHLQGGVL